jgi:hypothetical protein
MSELPMDLVAGRVRRLAEERHASVGGVIRHFRYEHLATGPLRELSRRFAHTAADVADALPDSPELTVCLRKLLEAKDCAVRALVDADGIDAPNRVVPQQPVADRTPLRKEER